MALLWVVSPAHAAQGETGQSHASIRKAAHALLAELTKDQAIPAEIEVGALDPRLRLTACGAPVEAFLPSATRPQGRMAVGVRCAGPKPWSLYVSASVKTFAKVLVTTRSLARGARIQAADLELEVRESDNLTASAVSDPARAIGMVLTRPLAGGAVIGRNVLKAPTLVHRGQQVIVIAEIAGLVVRSTGKALGNGASGELVRVRNSLSKQIIQGLVTSPGVVRVQM